MKRLSPLFYVPVAVVVAVVTAFLIVGLDGSVGSKTYKDGCAGSYEYMQDMEAAGGDKYWLENVEDHSDSEFTGEAMQWTLDYTKEHEPPEPIKQWFDHAEFELERLIRLGADEDMMNETLSGSYVLDDDFNEIFGRCAAFPITNEYFLYF